MKTSLLFGIIFFATSTASYAADSRSLVEPVFKPEQVTAAVREKLTPVIESALQEHCRNDCPSFRIDVHFKKSPGGLLDDLGFTKPADDSTPELQSISLSVLIHERVPQGSKEALRQILAHAAANESPVPVNVLLKPLGSLSPYLEMKSHAEPPLTPYVDQRLTWVKATIWPFCLALVATLGLIALLFILKNKRDLLRDRISAFKESQNQESLTPENPLVSTSPQAANFLETRPKDLHWLIEDLASRRDTQSLNRVILTYQPQDLTSQLKFSNATLKVLASLPPQTEKLNQDEALTWLKVSLDRVHWKRIEEQHLPLSRLGRLIENERSEVFEKLRSSEDRAVLIASIPEDKWPQLLIQLSSDERIQLGLALSRYQGSDFEERVRAEEHLSLELDRILASQSPCPSGILEDFTLYLTEAEGKRLWQGLSQKEIASGKTTILPPTLSVDALVQQLDLKETAEIFTGLELSTLGTLMGRLSEESRRKVMGTLPKSLGERLATYKVVSSEAQIMKARAHLLDAYRRFSSGSMVQ